MPKLIRVTTVPLALRTLLAGQMRYMKEKGWEVIMVSADGPEREAVIQNEGAPHIIVNMTRAITPFKDLGSLWKLYKLLKKEKPSIVHSHTPKAGLIAMIASKMAGVPVRIHTIAGLRFMTTTGFKRKLLVNMEKLTCKFAQHVWVNSFSLKKYIEENGLCNSRKLSVIGNGSTNGINLQRFDRSSLQPPIIEEIKQKINYNSSLYYFLFVGRIVKDKGIRELAVAFQKIYESNPNSRLVLVGALENELDPIDPATLSIIQSHPGIILAGWDNRIEYYFSLANVFVFPSHREGFPNVLLQAGAMGCPIICSRIPGNIDVVDHEQTGLIFPTGDELEIARQMEFALINADKMKQLANNLELKVRKDFSQIFVHQKIEENYRALINKPVAPNS